ncbi:MAG: transglutaminase domain-containing protein [Sedimentisphaerales bacterium]|nr:transglutaminase domain-containing protein [Sedimentisphaerales bacterium]
MKRVHCILQILLLTVLPLLCVSCGSQQGLYDLTRFEQVPAQEYFAKYLNGQRIGYAARSQIQKGDSILTTEVSNDSFTLLGRPISWRNGEMILETVDGTLVAYDSVMSHEGTELWILPVRHQERKVVRREEDGSYTFIAVVNGQQFARGFKWPDDALSPPAFRRLQKEKGLTPGTEYSANVYSIDRFTADEYSIRIVGPAQITLPEGTVSAHEIAGVINAKEGTFAFTEYVDDQFNTLKEMSSVGGLEMNRLACSPGFAKAPVGEVHLETVVAVTSPVPIKDSQGVSIVYHIEPRKGYSPAFPSTDYQSVEAQKDGSFLVRVHPLEDPSGFQRPYAGTDEAVVAAMKPTDLIQCDDPLIVKLAQQAVGNTADAAKAARKIESFVHGYISPDVHVVDSTMFPSALEVAQERKGVCRHYAVLTAALCRASGIPAQIVVGYVYVGDYARLRNAFVAHAWTQAYIGDRWIALDATRPTLFGMLKTHTVGHIATHINNGTKAELGDLMNTLATFQITAVQQ